MAKGTNVLVRKMIPRGKMTFRQIYLTETAKFTVSTVSIRVPFRHRLTYETVIFPVGTGCSNPVFSYSAKQARAVHKAAIEEASIRYEISS